MTRSASDAHGDGLGNHMCRFNGCDADATEAVGAVELCSLHRSLIEELKDHSDDPRVTAAIDEAVGE